MWWWFILGAIVGVIADWIFAIGDRWRNWRETRARRQFDAVLTRDLREAASITPREAIAGVAAATPRPLAEYTEQISRMLHLRHRATPVYELGSPNPFTYVEQRATVTGPQGPQGVRMPDMQRINEQMQGIIRSLDQISHTSTLDAVGLDWDVELERLQREHAGFVPITPQSYSRDLLPGPQGTQARVPKPPPEPEAPPTERQPRGIRLRDK